jgi:hypothetical protein
MNSDDWDTFTKNATDFAKDYPIDESKILLGEYTKWAAESLEISKSTVYNGFTKDGDQTDEYLKRAAPALKERIVYASHRLYATIVDIYGDDDVQEGAEVFSELFAAFL